ncbi:MAG: hypothetical protein GY791_13495 [Alphaproteobacteria bacterium]|nr:hypothetical protein [Alphaproteobacteria bacterium]
MRPAFIVALVLGLTIAQPGRGELPSIGVPTDVVGQMAWFAEKTDLRLPTAVKVSADHSFCGQSGARRGKQIAACFDPQTWTIYVDPSRCNGAPLTQFLCVSERRFHEAAHAVCVFNPGRCRGDVGHVDIDFWTKLYRIELRDALEEAWWRELKS